MDTGERHRTSPAPSRERGRRSRRGMPCRRLSVRHELACEQSVSEPPAYVSGVTGVVGPVQYRRRARLRRRPPDPDPCGNSRRAGCPRTAGGHTRDRPDIAAVSPDIAAVSTARPNEVADVAASSASRPRPPPNRPTLHSRRIGPGSSCGTRRPPKGVSWGKNLLSDAGREWRPADVDIECGFLYRATVLCVVHSGTDRVGWFWNGYVYCGGRPSFCANR